MARKPIPRETETFVLMRCRRRCCICFGLHRETSIKNGQIAHLDQNRNNNNGENLAFLCFDHHDEYDSRTSQRKNLTFSEVKAYRDELEKSLEDVFSQKVHFGYLAIPKADPFAGNYTRIGSGSDSAEIIITPLPDDPEGTPQYYVSGQALWGVDREHGPNMGWLGEVVGIEEEGCMRIHHQPFLEGGRAGTTEIICHLNEGLLVVREHNVSGHYGFNVTFEGAYTKSR